MLTKQELRQLGEKQVHEEVAKLSQELMQVKMNILSGSSKETHRLKLLKRQIARLKTMSTEAKNKSN